MTITFIYLTVSLTFALNNLRRCIDSEVNQGQVAMELTRAVASLNFIYWKGLLNIRGDLIILLY